MKPTASKLYTLEYLDCCYPDYFQGSRHDVLSVPVDGSTTQDELESSLRSEWNNIGHNFDMPEDSEIDFSSFFLADTKPSDIIFPDLEKREFNSNEDDDWEHEYSYAYFAIVPASE